MSVEFDDDWEEWDPSKGSFLVHMVAGSCAGMAEHVGMFPFDTIKTHLQVLGQGTNSKTLLRSIYHEGFFRLWRGAPAMAAACIPSHAAYFTVYEQAKIRLGVNQPGHQPLSAAGAGAFATLLHDAVITPMDVVKQRLQLGLYRGVWDCIKSIIRDEGFSALIRSYPTTVLMNIPYASVVVATNESMKEFLNPDGAHSMVTYFASGAVAGAVAAMITNPLDVVKTRIQTQSCIRPDCPQNQPVDCAAQPCGVKDVTAVGMESTGVRPTRAQSPYKGISDTTRRIIAEEGVYGFFKGAWARMVVHTPAMAISWGTYEFIKKMFSDSTEL